jgi:hypothetical protein
MRKALIIILALFLSSCNPFISKDLRRKNKCNRKLERVLRKCPELVKTDTVEIRVDTTIFLEGVKVDTVVDFHFDTLEIIKDKFHLKLVKSYDTLIVNGGCLPDTIKVISYVKVPFETFTPIKLTLLDRAANFLSGFWWILLLVVILYALKRFLNTR